MPSRVKTGLNIPASSLSSSLITYENLIFHQRWLEKWLGTALSWKRGNPSKVLSSSHAPLECTWHMLSETRPHNVTSNEVPVYVVSKYLQGRPYLLRTHIKCPPLLACASGRGSCGIRPPSPLTTGSISEHLRVSYPYGTTTLPTSWNPIYVPLSSPQNVQIHFGCKDSSMLLSAEKSFAW